MASSDWRPEQGQLEQLVTYLFESLNARNLNTRRQAELMLKQAKASPDFDNYLCYLLSGISTSQISNQDQTRWHLARSAAGLMLKNDIKSAFQSLPSSTQSYITENIFTGLHDSNAQIRNYCGLVIAELIRQKTVNGWPEAIQRLLATASNESGKDGPEAQEGAASALRSVCEDNKKALTKGDTSSLQFLLQKLIELLQSSRPKIRANAVTSLSVFMVEKSSVVTQNLSQILERLFSLANDPNADVRSAICEAIVGVAKVSPSVLVPYMDGLVDFMLSQQQDPDDSLLAVHAAEFWLSVADDPNTCNLLSSHLPKIVPVLLENMIYPEDDVLRLENEADDDADEDDRQQDIKPQFASSRAARAGASGENGDSANHQTQEDGDDDLSDGEIPEYAEGDDPEEQWTLRKCSAASLDTLAGVFPEAVFGNTLPYLRENLRHKDWQNREAAVLAIGAIAEGSMEVLEPHLPELVPFLVDLLSDKQAIVRQITCWSLGRYSAWASHLDEAGKTRYFVPMMDGILQRMLDSNKLVQEAAASAFANLEEKANKELANPAYCEVIVQQFAKCFTRYKERNIFILYDCVQTLAEHVATEPSTQEVIHHLMPPLIARWEVVKDTDQEMFPLLECLSYVASSLGPGFAPYAGPMFGRCVKIIYENLEMTISTADDPELEGPAPDFLITSLDLLSAIIQALGSSTGSLIRESTPNMFELLQICLENPNDDVRQSGYALLGDCAIHVFSDLEPVLNRIMPILVRQLTFVTDDEDAEMDYAVENNACWSCGEIAMRAGPVLEPFSEALMQHLYGIICDDKLPGSLHDNAALALGRLGNGCASKMAPHLATIGPPLIKRLHTIVWEDEKCHAMRGLSAIILENPEASESFLLDFVNEVGSGAAAPIGSEARFRASDGPYDLFQKVLTTYSSMVPNFKSILSHLPAANVQAIQHTFTV